MPKVPAVKTKEVSNEVITPNNEFSMESVSEKAETIERFKRERLKRNDTSCVEFWTCLVFQSYEQRNEFISQLKSKGISNILYDKYVDGEEFAELHGYRIEPNTLPPEKSNMNKNRTAMVNLEKIRSASK